MCVCIYTYVCISYQFYINKQLCSTKRVREEVSMRITKTPSVVAAFYIPDFFTFFFFIILLCSFTIPQFNLAIGRFSIDCLFGLFTRSTHTNSICHEHRKCWISFPKRICSMVSISCSDTNSLILFFHFPLLFVLTSSFCTPTNPRIIAKKFTSFH